jgi:type I restriction enzyme S subunit
LSPSAWPSLRIEEFADLGSGMTPLRSQGALYFGEGTPWVKTGDLNNSVIRRTEESLTQQAVDDYRPRIYPRDTVLLAMYGGFRQIGRTGLLMAPAAINQALTAIQVRDGLMLPRFLQIQLNARITLWRRLAGSSRKDPNITKEDISRFRVIMPPSHVQGYIVALHDALENVMTVLRRLISLKRRMRDGLMQNLLTGQRRLPSFANRSWHELPFGELFKQCDRFVDWDDDIVYDLVSVRRWAGGVYTRSQLRGQDIKVKTLKQICSGDILVSHIQSAYGAMAMVGPDHEGHYVSDLYMVLVPKDETLCDPRFFAWMCRTKWMWHQATVASNGFKAERLRILFDPVEFLRRKIRVPADRDEQSAIADVLDAATREIETLTRLRDAIAKQKRGLMQKLLTGEMRVPVNESATMGVNS